MSESADSLIDEMKGDVEIWLSGRDVDLQKKYGAAIVAVGTVPYLAEVFKRFGDATLARWLTRLIFVWKDLPFMQWKEILYRISDNAPAVYQFVIYVSEFLAIDVVRIINEDNRVHETARSFANSRFPNGGPAAHPAWACDVLGEHGVDPRELSRRLYGEGAPLKTRSWADEPGG